MVSLLPGSSSDANDMHWQPSSPHQPCLHCQHCHVTNPMAGSSATVLPASAPVPSLPFSTGSTGRAAFS